MDLRYLHENNKSKYFVNEDYREWTRKNYKFLDKNFKDIEKDQFDEENKDITNNLEEIEEENQANIKEEYNEFDKETYKELKNKSFEKKLKPIKNKFDCILFDKIILKSSDNQIRHTVESKKKLSIARRKRKKQPREGTSLKPKTFGEQLQRDYSKEFKKNKDVKNFIKKIKNKFKTASSIKEIGISTDYSTTSLTFVEVSVQQMLYDPQTINTDNFELKIDFKLDLDSFLSKLEEEVKEMTSNNYEEDFIQIYKELKTSLFELNYKVNLDNYIPEIKDVLYDENVIEKSEYIDDFIELGLLDF